MPHSPRLAQSPTIVERVNRLSRIQSQKIPTVRRDRSSSRKDERLKIVAWCLTSAVALVMGAGFSRGRVKVSALVPFL